MQSEERRNEAAPDRGTGHVLQDDEEKDRARDVEAEHEDVKGSCIEAEDLEGCGIGQPGQRCGP